MAAAGRVAIVTGANKGIGYAVVKGIAQKFDGYVYLTSRNVALGEEATAKLKSDHGASFKCKELRYHQLDITDNHSVRAFADYLKKTHGGIDILVNNAGIAYKQASTASFEEQARETLKINYFGTLNACRALFPLLRPHARVVNVSSRAGLLGQLKSDDLKQKFMSADLTEPVLTGMMMDFQERAKAGTHQDAGYSNSSYGMSKVGMTALSKVLQREVDASGPEGVVVVAMCPGYVDTDMTSHKGHLTVDEGAKTPLFLAFLPEGHTEAKGGFYADQKPYEWNSVMRF